MTGATVARTVDWIDTDAAGHYHHSAVIRWVEAAENALHEELGLRDLFGTAPRVRYEVDYLDRLWFREQVDTTLWVEKVGTASLTYGFQVVGPRGPAARGRMVCVNVGPVDSVDSAGAAGSGSAGAAGSAGGAGPWPPEVRERLKSRAAR